jgi:hypothetical protein
MSTVDLWRAVGEQAAVWARTPTAGVFARELPRNAAQRSKGLPGLLRRVQGGAGFVDAQPLRLATNLRMALEVMDDVDPKTVQADHPAWLTAAIQIEGAHRSTIAWLRARLAGYPGMPAPQLTAGSPLTTSEFTHRLIWSPGERGMGLQFGDPRPEVAEALGVSDAQRRALDESARSVAAAFAATPEWQRLDAAAAALDDAARAELTAARKRLRERLSPARVDDFEPVLALERAKYRQAVVDQELATLAGAAAEYAAAFDAANLLLEVAASDVFAQLLCYRTPTLSPRSLEVQQDDQRRLRFTLDEGTPTFPEAGLLVWLDAGLHWDGAKATHHVGGRILAGSADAWRGD